MKHPSDGFPLLLGREGPGGHHLSLIHILLVNGAGIQYRCPAEDFPPERWQQILRINLDAVFRLAQLAGRTMLAQGGGRIINVASMTSFFGSEQIPAYAASKGAVAQLTKALSNEWAGRGVNVNAIAPGYMVTQLLSLIHISPLGFLLSGGLDSSLVCAISAKLLGKPIRTFAIGMDTDPIDLKLSLIHI